MSNTINDVLDSMIEVYPRGNTIGEMNVAAFRELEASVLRARCDKPFDFVIVDGVHFTVIDDGQDEPWSRVLSMPCSTASMSSGSYR